MSLPPTEPPVPEDPAALREALAGVRALILDADGVLVAEGVALRGVGGALSDLASRGIPVRVATNMSSIHRTTLAARWADQGLPLGADAVVTAASATAAHTAAAHPGLPLYVITRADGLREWLGQRLLTHDDAADPDCGAAAVVIGDGGEDLTYTNLDRAFRLIRNGAELLACHRNAWWITARGPTMDAGGFVGALEFAAGVRATICGKPGPIMYRTAFAGVAAELRARGERRLLPREVAMIGDDARQDLAGARRLGMRGILTLSGRTTPAEAAALRSRAGGPRPPRYVPDAVARSLVEVVAALA